jgi:hypothetical protein
MSDNIAGLISDLCDESQTHEKSCDVTSSSIRVVHVPVPADLHRDLQIISAEFKRDLNCLAGDLLTIAIREAFASLPKEEQSRLKGLEVTTAKQDSMQQMEACKYDAGAP